MTEDELGIWEVKVSYKEDLIRAIEDSNKWPSFERPNFLIDLNVVADDSFEKNTVEGYLAALLVYHQLCEEIIRLILRDTQFFIQLSVFPQEISFPEKKRQMFGQLLEDLKATISFDGKDDLIAKCVDLNKKRIEIVHNLTRMTSVSQINEGASRIKMLYDEIYSLFEEIHDYFRVCFKDFRKDVEWDEYLGK